MILRPDLKAVFFDLDNTLWDFEKSSTLTLEELYDEMVSKSDTLGAGKEKFIEVYKANNEKLWEQYRNGNITKSALRGIRFKEALHRIGIDNATLGQTMETEYVSRVPLKPNLIDGALEILDWLYGKYKLGIITNGFMEAQEAKVRLSGIDRYFDYFVISEEAGCTKPNPSIFKFALNKCTFKEDEVAYIGDEYDVDIKGAFGAGIEGIWLKREGTRDKNTLCCIEITSLLELKNIL